MRVLITGHSRGLGEALARCFLEEKAFVLGVARHENPTLKAQYGALLQEVALDLSDRGAVERFLKEAVLRDFCAFDDLLLINCAGVQAPAEILGEQSSEKIMSAMFLNATVPLLLSNALRLYAKKRLDILHISSGAAHKAYPAWSVYGASKAALDHHARCVASEAQEGLRIVSLAPGVVDTKMQEEIRENVDFPLRARFLDLKREGALQNAMQTAQAIFKFWQSADFGREAVVDLRDTPWL